MRKFAKTLLLLIAIFFMTSCAGTKSPVTGFIYTKVSAAHSATAAEGASKVGEATCKSILGWIASGDCSIEAAAKSAGITKVHHVDYDSFSILGFYATYKVKVYGE